MTAGKYSIQNIFSQTGNGSLSNFDNIFGQPNKVETGIMEQSHEANTTNLHGIIRWTESPNIC